MTDHPLPPHRSVGRSPQRVTATAQVIFQRFWFVTSMRQFSVADVSAACLYLATKIEEHPVPVRKLINVFDYTLQHDRWRMQSPDELPWRTRGKSRRSKGTSNGQQDTTSTPTRQHDANFHWQPHSYQSSVFHDYKDSLVVHEMQILKRLGFQLEAQLPYSTLVNYLQILGLGKDKEVVERCWAIVTDM